MNKICNYPNQDDYETEEEYNEALEWYWMELDRQYDEWKDEQLEKDRECQWKYMQMDVMIPSLSQ